MSDLSYIPFTKKKKLCLTMLPSNLDNESIYSWETVKSRVCNWGFQQLLNGTIHHLRKADVYKSHGLGFGRTTVSKENDNSSRAFIIIYKAGERLQERHIQVRLTLWQTLKQLLRHYHLQSDWLKTRAGKNALNDLLLQFRQKACVFPKAPLCKDTNNRRNAPTQKKEAIMKNHAC